MTCEHKFVYGGVKYDVKNWLLPGSGAHPVHYYDWFFCEKCLFDQYQKLNHETDTYNKISFNATPLRIDQKNAS